MQRRNDGQLKFINSAKAELGRAEKGHAFTASCVCSGNSAGYHAAFQALRRRDASPRLVSGSGCFDTVLRQITLSVDKEMFCCSTKSNRDNRSGSVRLG